MNSRDLRTPFDEAKASFVAFLESQGWPTDLLWLARDRITGWRNRFWVFRPVELTDDASSRMFYESARESPSSIRLDGLGVFQHRTIAYVEEYGRDSRLLNFGVRTGAEHLAFVQSRVRWQSIRYLNAIRGESPTLRSLRIPPTASAA